VAGATRAVLIDKTLESKLDRHKTDVLKLLRHGKDVLFKLSYELFQARNTCLEHDSETSFGEWVEGLGISRSSAYRAISRWEIIAPHILTDTRPSVGQPPPFGGFLCFAQFEDSALDELAKPSTPKQALTKAIQIAQSGKGMTRKEALDLIAKLSDKGKPGGVRASSSSAPVSPGPATGEAADPSGEEDRTGTKPQEQGPRPPRSGKEKPGVASDKLGKCPNCASTKWTKDDFGCVVCAKCHHPHGEPTGGADEDRIGVQRSKTVKTAEALMRAFDDLNYLLAKPDEHTEAIASCKFLLKTARAWK